MSAFAQSCLYFAAIGEMLVDVSLTSVVPKNKFVAESDH